MSSLLKQRPKKGKPQDGKQWLHPADLLTEADVVYPVKLLGVTEVTQAKGTEVIKDAITKVQFAKHIKQSEAGKKGRKLRKVDLKISIKAIKVDDTKTKEEIYSYPLHHISYCADDKRSKKVFAFIAKDKSCPQHTCYVFECEKMAEELTLTVGQAFDLAYRRYLENVGRQKLQAAESEKEGMKEKLSQLTKSEEPAPTQPVGNTALPNWSTQAPANTKQEDINLFGDETPVPGIPPPPQHTRPPKTNTFDPFDMSSPTTNGDSPSNSLSEFDQQPVAPNTISSPFEDSPSPSPLNKVANPFDQMFEQSPTAPASSGDFIDSFDPLDNVPPSQPNTTPPANTQAYFHSDLLDNGSPLDAGNNNGTNDIFAPQPVQRPRPTPRTQIPASLPPPPSKQSVKAAKLAAAAQAAGNTAGTAPASAPLPISEPSVPPQPSTDLFGLEPVSSATSPGNPFNRPANFDPFAESFDPLDSTPTQVNNNQIQDLQSGFSKGMALDSNDLWS